MVEFERTPPTEGSQSSMRICVVGIGGAGSNVIDRITVDRTLNATLCSLQTDVRVLNQSMAPKKIQLGAELMRGIGTGGDPDLGREAAIYSKVRIREIFEGHDMIFLAVGLGGGTGSGAAPVVAEIAKSVGAVVVVFAAVPFSFEGRRRQQQCNEALERLEKTSDALVLFENNRMGELVLGKEGIQKTFAQADTLIGQSVRAVSAMVSQPGLVKLGLADLVAALRVSDGRCLFGFGEAKGQNRGVEAMKRALKSPLINNGELLRHARNLLVHIVGGESLTLAEVEIVMKQLSRHVPDETQLLFGVSVDTRLGETVSVTLISALSSEELANSGPPQGETTRVQLPPAPPSPPAPLAPVAEVAPPAAPAAPPPMRQPAPEPTAVKPSPEVVAAFAPPIDLFGEPVKPSAKSKAVAPVEALAEDEPEQPVPAPTKPPVKAAAPPPLPKSSGFSLSSVISGNDGGSQGTRRQDPARYAPQPVSDVVEPVPETTQIKLPERIVARPAPVAQVAVPSAAAAAVVAEAPAAFPAAPEVAAVVHYEPDPEPEVETVAEAAEEVFDVQIDEPEEEVANPDLFGEASSPEPLPEPVVAVVREEQATMAIGTENRGRFSGTEAAVVQGEDLDTPTWMRMRRRPGK